jgi:hypothetical protein
MVIEGTMPGCIQDGDRGGREELAAGVLKYVEEKRRATTTVYA